MLKVHDTTKLLYFVDALLLKYPRNVDFSDIPSKSA